MLHVYKKYFKALFVVVIVDCFYFSDPEDEFYSSYVYITSYDVCS